MEPTSESKTDTVRSYVERVLELQARRRAQLSEGELREIASELGVGDADLVEVESAAAEAYTRGQGHLRYCNYGDAIRELEDACSLAPRNVEHLHALAQAHAARYRQSDEESDLTTAIALCNRTLAISATHEPSFGLLAGLKKSQAKPGLTKKGWLLIAGVAVAGGGIALAMAPPRDEHAPPPSHAASVAEDASDEPGAPLAGSPAGSPAVEKELTLDVEWVGREGLEFTAVQSQHNNYDDSSFYRLAATVKNTGTTEVSELKLKLQMLDAAGEPVGLPESVEAIRSYEAMLRPGDTAGFDQLHRSSHEAASVRMTVSKLDAQPAPKRYPDLVDVPLAWPDGLRPDWDLKVGERSHRVSSGFSTSNFNGSFELRNVGDRVVRGLKIRANFLDAQGKQIAHDETYVVTNQEPPLPGGQSRSFVVLEGIPEGYASYQLQVVSID